MAILPFAVDDFIKVLKLNRLIQLTDGEAGLMRLTNLQHLECRTQHYSNPPSITKHCPVMYEARSEARNATVSATSSGLPMRPSAVLFKMFSTSPFFIPATISVSMSPGATAFTLIPIGPSSRASALVKLMAAPLLAA